MTAAPVSPEFAAEATAIDDARRTAYAELQTANARGLTGTDVDAMCTAIDALTERCEQLRRRYFPHRHKLIITIGAAMTISATGRSRQIVWTRPRDESHR